MQVPSSGDAPSQSAQPSPVDLLLAAAVMKDNHQKAMRGKDSSKQKVAQEFEDVNLDRAKVRDLNQRLQVKQMQPPGPQPMSTDEFRRQRQINQWLVPE